MRHTLASVDRSILMRPSLRIQNWNSHPGQLSTQKLCLARHFRCTTHSRVAVDGLRHHFTKYSKPKCTPVNRYCIPVLHCQALGLPRSSTNHTLPTTLFRPLPCLQPQPPFGPAPRAFLLWRRFLTLPMQKKQRRKKMALHVSRLQPTEKANGSSSGGGAV